jgi:pyruvate carboxylase
VEVAEPAKETVIISATEMVAVAQMPGSVWKIVVSAGEDVTQDQTVLIPGVHENGIPCTLSLHWQGLADTVCTGRSDPLGSTTFTDRHCKLRNE